MLCTMIAFHLAQGDNVTTTVSPGVKHSDFCTNECDETNPSYWCGQYKTDEAGKVMKCTEFTVNDWTCVSECVKRDDGYHVCQTNINRLAKGTWWDYCSLWGNTTKGAHCVDTCSQHGEDYFWCHTDKSDESAWDYCSPQPRVRPLQYTYRGGRCIGECKQWEEDYYWCKKNLHHCSGGRGGTCDAWWDYCSPDPWHTRYNKKCKEECSWSEEGYHWCYEEDGGWDYCSPAPEMGVDVKDHMEVSIYGVRCSSICSDWGESYNWCRLYGGKDGSAWDYCSTSPNLTTHSAECTDECARRKEEYFWCNTAESWDYCSPTVSDGNFYVYGTHPSYLFVWIFWLPLGIICCCGLMCFCKIRVLKW